MRINSLDQLDRELNKIRENTTFILGTGQATFVEYSVTNYDPRVAEEDDTNHTLVMALAGVIDSLPFNCPVRLAAELIGDDCSFRVLGKELAKLGVPTHAAMSVYGRVKHFHTPQLRRALAINNFQKD